MACSYLELTAFNERLKFFQWFACFLFTFAWFQILSLTQSFKIIPDIRVFPQIDQILKVVGWSCQQIFPKDFTFTRFLVKLYWMTWIKVLFNHKWSLACFTRQRARWKHSQHLLVLPSVQGTWHCLFGESASLPMKRSHDT